MEYPHENAEKYVKMVAADEGFEKADIILCPGSNKGDNYLGVILKVTISNKNEKQEKLNLILKTAPDYVRDKIRIEIFYLREMYCYSKIFPIFKTLQDFYDVPSKMRFSHPKYYIGDDTYMKELFIMNDLSVEGFQMGNRIESFSYDQIALGLKSLANLHSLSFALKKHNKAKFTEITENIHKGEEFSDVFRQMMDIVSQRTIEVIVEDIAKDKMEKFCKNLYAKFLEYVSVEAAAPYTVLCHGDCWINNMLFRYEVSCII
jgi:hypothetical protein